MSNADNFKAAMENGYHFSAPYLLLGTAQLDDHTIPEAQIKVPLKMMNRHGLIAGATGTGKTKTLQCIAEGLSEQGVPVLLMDIKGDLSGIAMPGVSNAKIEERYTAMGLKWSPMGYPVEFLTLSQEKGTRLRATVTDFGAVLLSKILGLNDNQESVMAMIFKYCTDNAVPLTDLRDLAAVLQFAMDDGKSEISKTYGNISSASVGTILRKVVELQNQGGDLFFGEPSFDTNDLLRNAPDGKGIISVFRVTDIQDRPKLFSTFMLQLLTKLYRTLPEIGDPEKPRLVLFIDEAHLVFNEAGKALLDQINTIIKLIRSKGVGVYFCTQSPTDVPASVLGQLGMKVQHSLRAFTANDRKAIKAAAQNYPESPFYKTEDIITQMGTGIALISVLNEKGLPTPLAQTMMVSPRSRMDILTDEELNAIVSSSALYAKYNTVRTTPAAAQILAQKKKESTDGEEDTPANGTKNSDAKNGKNTRPEPNVFSEIVNSSAGKQVQRSLIRMIFQFLTKLLTGKSR